MIESRNIPKKCPSEYRRSDIVQNVPENGPGVYRKNNRICERIRKIRVTTKKENESRQL